MSKPSWAWAGASGHVAAMSKAKVGTDSVSPFIHLKAKESIGIGRGKMVNTKGKISRREGGGE